MEIGNVRTYIAWDSRLVTTDAEGFSATPLWSTISADYY